LYRSQRFAERGSQFRGRAAERGEHLLLAGGLRLLLAERVTALTIDCVQSKDVLRAQAGDGSGKHCLAADAQAQITRQVNAETLVGRAAHEGERLLDSGWRHHAQEWRLVEAYGQGLLQRAVEHRVAGSIGEVSQHNRVLLRELG